MMARTGDRTGLLQGTTPLVRWQLAIFSVLTVIGLVVMAGVYVGLPAMFGIGRYRVTVQLAASGGLYPHSNVSYRGTNVGTVTDVRLTPTGVDASMSIGSEYKIPDSVTAAVRSVSAVGEQYIDLVPVAHDTGNLREGSVIPVGRTSLPKDVGPLLNQADRLLAGLNNTRLQAVVDQAFTAFDGSGPDLARLLDSAHLLLQQANLDVGPTKQLIEQVGPLLDTQRIDAQQIRAWTANLATVTDQLRAHDPQLRNILRQGPETIEATTTLFQNIRPTLPMMLANLVSVGQVSATYLAGIEQVLVVFPPLVTALVTSATGGPVKEGALVDFMLQVNDPPACTTGFLPADQWRSPADTRPAPPTPTDLYCKVAHNSPIDVRGVHNAPCPNDPNKRAPTPELCGVGQSYRPVGTNPPFGPPQPAAAISPQPQPIDGRAQPSAYTRGVASRPYDPITGIFVGPDGRTYSQPDLAPGGAATVPRDWQTMMINQQQGR